VRLTQPPTSFSKATTGISDPRHDGSNSPIATRVGCGIQLGTPGSSLSHEAKQLDPGSAGTWTASEQPKPKDAWDKADVIGKLLGSILIPFGIAAVGYFVNITLQDRAAKQKGPIHTNSFDIVSLDEHGAFNRLSGLQGSCP
jgi:hypothetical protein